MKLELKEIDPKSLKDINVVQQNLAEFLANELTYNEVPADILVKISHLLVSFDPGHIVAAVDNGDGTMTMTVGDEYYEFLRLNEF